MRLCEAFEFGVMRYTSLYTRVECSNTASSTCGAFIPLYELHDAKDG